MGLRCFWSALLLAHGFKKYNCNGSSKIQATRSMHWDANATIFVGREQILREAFCFRAKHQKIIRLKCCLVVRTLTLCRQKKIIRIRRLCALESAKGIPKPKA